MVTGATGFFGKAVVQRLLAEDELRRVAVAEVLDFAEFLRLKRGPVEHVASSLRLSDLCGGLAGSLTFNADPMAIQRQLRDEWH